jgi:hypothetical protein
MCDFSGVVYLGLPLLGMLALPLLSEKKLIEGCRNLNFVCYEMNLNYTEL